MARARLRWRLVAVILGVLLGVWLVIGAVQVLASYRDAKAAQASLDSAKSELAGGGITSGAALGPLRSASTKLSDARRLIDGPGVLLIRQLPYLGRQVRAVGSLAGSGGRIASITAAAVRQVSALLSHHPLGEARVVELRQLGSIAAKAETELRAVPVVSDSGLIGPVRRRRDELDSELTKGLATLDKARAAAGAMADLLQGPSRYLLLVANNGEMRAGSGSFLTAGLLEGSEGSLTLTSLVSTANLVLGPGVVPISGDLEARWGWLDPSQEWRNLGTTPEFPVTASLAARMWQAYSGQPVQGVLAVDIPAFRLVLGVTGPVTVDGKVFDQGNVEEYLMHDQYAGASFLPAQDAARTALLHQLASAALHDIQSGRVSLTRMSSQLGSVVSGRHLMVWSADAARQRAWVAAGVSGSVGADDIMLSVINRGGNKLDQYLQTSAVLSTTSTSSGTDVTVTATLQNTTPPGQAAFIAGPNPDLAQIPYGTYTGLASLDLPARARMESVKGVSGLAAEGPDGPGIQVFAAPVSIPAGASTRISWRFRLPKSTTSLVIDASARVEPTRWSFGDVRFEDLVPRMVTW